MGDNWRLDRYINKTSKQCKNDDEKLNSSKLNIHDFPSSFGEKLFGCLDGLKKAF